MSNLFGYIHGTFFLEVFYQIWYTAPTGFFTRPESEVEIFSDNFDPHGLAAQTKGKLTTTSGYLKLNSW